METPDIFGCLLKEQRNALQFVTRNVASHRLSGEFPLRKVYFDILRSHCPQILILNKDRTFGTWFVKLDCVDIVALGGTRLRV